MTKAATKAEKFGRLVVRYGQAEVRLERALKAGHRGLVKKLSAQRDELLKEILAYSKTTTTRP